jgi:hypothetical protein
LALVAVDLLDDTNNQKHWRRINSVSDLSVSSLDRTFGPPVFLIAFSVDMDHGGCSD